MAQNWVREELKAIGLHEDGEARVRSRAGGIPGVSPQSSKELVVVIYDSQERAGRLFILREEASDRVVIERNCYRLSREGNAWSASEGNGGLGTYRTIGEYASEVFKRPPRVIHLTRATTSCPVRD